MQSVAYEASKTGWDRDATYTDTQGRPIDLAGVRTTSLAGMIDAKRQLDAVQSGSIVTQLKDGRTIYALVTMSKEGKVIYPLRAPWLPMPRLPFWRPPSCRGWHRHPPCCPAPRGRWSIAWHDRGCFVLGCALSPAA